MLRDPISFQDANEVLGAVIICQKVLADNQISTMHQSARQLTPISIPQLTHPEWSKDFGRLDADESEPDE
jgi:hypothetical protein